MEQNRLESVHTIVCDAIAHHFPDWKERSRVSYEIAFKMLGDFIEHKCPLLVHTKLVEPEIKPVDKEFIDQLGIKVDSDPPIDAEGWDNIINLEINKIIDSAYNKSKINGGILKRGSANNWVQVGPEFISYNYYLNNEKVKMKIRGWFDEDNKSNWLQLYGICEINELQFFLLKNLVKEGGEFRSQCFKIANYICSRLCDKIEK